MTIRVGILETGMPPIQLRSRFGSYGEMFQRLLGRHYDYATFDVPREEYPPTIGYCDAYILTGSAAGIHDGDGWIRTLKSFLWEVAGRTVLVGVCFGHQVMAEVFGGRVTSWPGGWGLGLHTYEVKYHAAWMDNVPIISVPVSHRDQVVELPKGAMVVAGNAFTPFGALLYPERRALSFQCHPEFSVEYAAALVEARRGIIYSDLQAAEAIASLRKSNDSARVASWIRGFMESIALGTTESAA